MADWTDYLNQVKGFEGFTPRATWDYKQSSNGYGTRAQYPGEVVDRGEADRRLNTEWGQANNQVRAFASDLTPGQEAALTSLTFNAGPGWQKAGLGQAVKAGDWDTARTLFAQYNKAGGEVLPGLVARRNAELSWLGGPPHSTDAPTQQLPPTRQAPPMADEQQDTGILGGLTRAMRSPLFLTGASIFNQAYQPGGNVGAGIMGGLQAAQQANAADLQNLKTQREMQRQQQTDQFWQQLRGAQPPEWAKGLPPALLGIAGQLPPDQAALLITNHIQGTLKQAEPMYQAQLKKAQLEADQPSEEFKVIGKDQYGGDRYGWVNRHTQVVRPADLGATSQNDAHPGMTGEEFLKTLPTSIGTQVKGIAEGRIPYPGAFALKNPYWQRVTEALSRYEPNADANLFRTRYATQKDFATGAMGKNIASFNTALGHMHDLYTQIDGLGNLDTLPILNGPINVIAGATSGTSQAKIDQFNATASKVLAEAEKAFKGTGATVFDMQHARAELNASKSPSSLKATVRKYLDLMESRIEAIGDQYNRGMGVAQPRAALSLLSPKSQKIVAELKKKEVGGGDHMVASPQPAPDPSSAPIPGAKLAPDGRWYVPDPNRPGKFMQVQQ